MKSVILNAVRGSIGSGLLGRSSKEVAASLLICSQSFATSPNQLSLIKKLRDQSGAPISDVKKALEETEWDIGEEQLCILLVLVVVRVDDGMLRACGSCRSSFSGVAEEGIVSGIQEGIS
jgi:hypothetical protein